MIGFSISLFLFVFLFCFWLMHVILKEIDKPCLQIHFYLLLLKAKWYFSFAHYMLLIHFRVGRDIWKDYEPAYNRTNRPIWIKMLISKGSFNVSRGLAPPSFKKSYLKFSSLFLINNTRVSHLSAFHFSTLPWVAVRTSVEFFSAHVTILPNETIYSLKECLVSFDLCSFPWSSPTWQKI